MGDYDFSCFGRVLTIRVPVSSKKTRSDIVFHASAKSLVCGLKVRFICVSIPIENNLFVFFKKKGKPAILRGRTYHDIDPSQVTWELS